MHLSSFGLISLDGTVAKPEPGLNFANYQIAMAHYSTAIALRSRLKMRANQPPVTEPNPQEAASPVVETLPIIAPPENMSKPLSAAATLVRHFRR